MWFDILTTELQSSSVQDLSEMFQHILVNKLGALHNIKVELKKPQISSEGSWSKKLKWQKCKLPGWEPLLSHVWQEQAYFVMIMLFKFLYSVGW